MRPRAAVEESPNNWDGVERVRTVLRSMDGAVVAFSGGVDSSLLAYLAHQELGARSVSVTAVSPSFAKRELEDARAFAERFGIRHVLMEVEELGDPRYVENSPLRCYWCKRETFARLMDYARANGFAAVLDGTNLDDTADYRPGRIAAEERAVRSPFLEAGMTKADIRASAKALGLPNWDKPAKACLASRIPTGIPVTAAVLSRVERAEDVLSALGIRQCRVRHHREIARIEVEVDHFPSVLNHKEEIIKELNKLGYRFVTLDLAGYRSGGFHQDRNKEYFAGVR